MKMGRSHFAAPRDARERSMKRGIVAALALAGALMAPTLAEARFSFTIGDNVYADGQWFTAEEYQEYKATHPETAPRRRARRTGAAEHRRRAARGSAPRRRDDGDGAARRLLQDHEILRGIPRRGREVRLRRGRSTDAPGDARAGLEDRFRREAAGHRRAGDAQRLQGHPVALTAKERGASPRRRISHISRYAASSARPVRSLSKSGAASRAASSLPRIAASRAGSHASARARRS